LEFERAMILLLKACRFVEPLVAKFHATGWKESVNLKKGAVYATNFPDLHVANDTIVDFAE